MTEEAMTFEDQLAATLSTVSETNAAFETAAWERLDSLTKPPRSLGRLEELAARIARIQETDRPQVERKAILLMAGDHGVVAEGVSPYPQDVTWQMVANFSAGGAAINQIARTVGADVRVYDVGVASDVSGFDGIEVRKVAEGTANMAVGPAMTREECAQAVMTGVAAAREAAEQGFTVLGLGEMGIGNTTAAAALAGVFTGSEPELVCGRGTGLDDAGVARKVEVVRRALDVNHTSDLDALGVLAAVGGLEIAAMAGVVIGAAQERVTVVMDGFVTSAAALAAVALCPAAADYLIASHRSVEPGHTVVLAAMGAEPLLELQMRLGEGTGAALAIGLIDSACAMMSGMATFAEAGVSGSEDE